jgi:hypothetical protein
MDPSREAPCGTCKPILLPENQEAVSVYFFTRNQLITAGMGTVIDISIPAVKIVMDLYGVEDQLDCLQKVVHLFHEFRPKEKE